MNKPLPKHRIIHRGSGRQDHNRFECEGHVDRDVCLKIQEKLGFPEFPYGIFDIRHLTDDVLLTKITTWKCHGSSD